MEEEPFDRPGNDALDDSFTRPPVVLDGVVNAKGGKRWWMAKAIDVLGWFTGAAWIGTDRRIEHEHADVMFVT
jgi:hypothetical protein